jgi:hypothetical protein
MDASRLDGSSLPKELWNIVFRMLTVRQAKRAGAVCKSWRSRWADCITDIEVLDGDEIFLKNVCREVIPSKITSFLTDVVVDQIIGSYLETFPNLRVLKARFEDNNFSTLQANLSKLTDLDMDLCNAYETVSIAHIEGLVNNNTRLTALILRVRTDKLLPSFMKLTNLRQLSLVDNGRNTANIHVSNSTCLTKLAILAKTLDSNIMHEISNKLPNLESLLVDEDAREGFDWSWLKNMTNLKYLDYRPQNTTNEVIKFIGALKKLNVLKFGTSYSHQPANFAPLGALTNLESLYIQMHTSHKNQNESFIGNLINLKILKIMVGPLSGFSDLGLLKNLKELQLDICNASQIMQINRLDNLKSLSIGGPDLKDFPWRRLKLNSLEKLEVKSDVFEFIPWRSLPSLSDLSIRQPSAASAKEFQQLSRLTRLKFLPSLSEGWPDDRMVFLTVLVSLRELETYGAKKYAKTVFANMPQLSLIEPPEGRYYYYFANVLD